MNVNIANTIAPIAASHGRAPEAAANNDGFSFAAIMGAARQQHAGRAMFMQPGPLQADEANSPVDFKACLDALRSAFLTKGKPFGKVYLSANDAPLLADFLRLSGYNQRTSQELVGGLLEKSPAGRLSMSRFMAGVKAAGPPVEKEKQAVFLDASVAPYVESMLRAFDLSDEEIGTIMNRGRRKDGSLDLTKVVRGMQAAGPGAMAAGRGIIDSAASPQSYETLAALGIVPDSDGRSQRVSIVDAARSMGMAAKGAEKSGRSLTLEDWQALNSRRRVGSGQGFAGPGDTVGNHDKPGVPEDVSRAIARILEKATTGDRTDNDLTDIITGSKIKFEDPGEKSLAAAREAEAAKTKAPLQGQAAAAHSQGEGEKAVGMHLNEARKAAGEAADAADANDIRGARAAEGRPVSATFETVADRHAAKAPAGSAHAAEQRPQPSENALPRYVIGQLGNQIEKSLARGDGIVRMRLKPAELGSVRLEMQVSENRMNISVVAENGRVRELLLANVQELKDLLQGQGIRLEKLDVNVGGDFGRAFSGLNEGGHSGNSHRDNGTGSTLPGGEDSGDTQHHGTRGRARQDAMVDLVA